jgi:glycosyltransferase involved in cell wall biosynthesis
MGDRLDPRMSDRRQYLINGRFMGRPVTGVERFARETLIALDQHLDDLLPGAELLMACPPGTPDTLGLKHVRVVHIGTRQGHAWEQWDLARHRPELPLISLCNTAPVLRSRQIAVIHDAAVFSLPEAYGWKFRLAYKLLHHALARSGAHLMTVSRFSQAELSKHLKVPAASIGVIPESGEHMQRLGSDDRILDKHNLHGRPYVLAVSSNHLGKNFAFVAEALLRLGRPDFDVVVAGGSNSAVFSQRGAALPPFIKRVGYVSDEELNSLYRHATCFAFPSIYEGFGLPPLEAMSLGCPVLAAQAASIPEVCGSAATYFNPREPESFVRALESVMMAPPDQSQARRAESLSHSKMWTWQQAAQALALKMKAIS